jgi:hypothetical protein
MIKSLVTMAEAIWAIGATVRDNIKSEMLRELVRVKCAILDIQHRRIDMNMWK